MDGIKANIAQKRRGENRIKNLSLNLLVILGSSLCFLVFVEILLHVFPTLLPVGTYGKGVFDPELNTYLYKTPVIYKKVRSVKRTPNRDGFLDVDHEASKPPGVIRVSFWGDSYVESVQVPMEQTFWQNIPKRIADQNIETLAFGISGWGTLHALLASRKFRKWYDVDVVIYFFVKNDPGDHFFPIQHALHAPQVKPSALLADNIDSGYTIQWHKPPEKQSLSHKIADGMSERSLLMDVILSRIKVFLRSLDQADLKDSSAKKTVPPHKMPDPNDYPSTWPYPVLAEAKELTQRILSQMRKEVESEGRHFAVLYVPRGTEEVLGTLSDEDVWYPWLSETLTKQNIPLINPIPALKNRYQAGDAIYDDHWTPASHEVIAKILVDYIHEYLINTETLNKGIE